MFRQFNNITFIVFMLWGARLAQAQDGQLVEIGLIYPLSGAMSSFGEDVAKALPILERKFNSEQSKYKFRLVIDDGVFGQGNAAITAARKFIDLDGMKFLVVGSSGEVLQVAPIAEAAHVLLVAGFASHPAIRSAGEYVFRTYIDIDRGMQVIMNDLAQQNVTRVAVITETSSFTSAVVDSLKSGLRDRIVFSDEYLVGEGDFKGFVALAKSKSPQVYYLNTTTPASFVNLLRQLRASGAAEPIYTYYTPSLAEVQQALGTALNGTRYLDFPDTKDASEDFIMFLKEFEKAQGATPKALFNFRTNYNAIKVLYDAIVAVGPDPTKARDYLYTYDRLSATGRLRFDSNGDAVGLELILKTYGS